MSIIREGGNTLLSPLHWPGHDSHQEYYSSTELSYDNRDTTETASIPPSLLVLSYPKATARMLFHVSGEPGSYLEWDFETANHGRIASFRAMKQSHCREREREYPHHPSPSDWCQGCVAYRTIQPLPALKFSDAMPRFSSMFLAHAGHKQQQKINPDDGSGSGIGNGNGNRNTVVGVRKHVQKEI